MHRLDVDVEVEIRTIAMHRLDVDVAPKIAGIRTGQWQAEAVASDLLAGHGTTANQAGNTPSTHSIHRSLLIHRGVPIPPCVGQGLGRHATTLVRDLQGHVEEALRDLNLHW